MAIHNHLTALGPVRALNSFENSDWLVCIKGKFPELYRNEQTRRTWWFQTARLQQRELVSFSHRWPQLIFLLEFDNETKREIGIFKAVDGKLEHCLFTY